ncbi:MAG: family 20 glycosylhydrolase [Bacteroidota bacterium]
MKMIPALVTLMVLAGSARGQSVSFIPKPQKVQVSKGTFTLNSKTRLVVDAQSKVVGEVARLFQTQLRKVTGFPFQSVSVTSLTNVGNTIFLTDRLPKRRLGNEGYQIHIKRNSITLAAPTAAGLFYAVQTFFQLLPAEVERGTLVKSDWKIACVDIQDIPRFPWRGMHLDVCRHFFSKEFVKHYLDLMAAYKLNTFHWHLTEDQGWRIEIKKYPRLTEIGSQRAETMGDSTPHGGFYTQEDIREIVAYAKQRFITVVPEIEMPGHSTAALAAYPELSCTGGPFKVGTVWGVYNDLYCAGNEKTFEFLQDVLTEVMDLFPGQFIHLGGDECPKVRWASCPKCQARMKNEGLKDERELQSYFIKRMEKFVNSKGKRIIGWDEILEGGLAPNAAVMSWRGTQGGIDAARSGHDVVMTPTDYCYFDYYQGLYGEPKAIGGYLPIDSIYLYEPVPEKLSDDDAKHILGAQANMWTEYLPAQQNVEYMLLPRMLALSEVVWSPKSYRDLGDFTARLPAQYDRLAARGVNFRVPPPEGIHARMFVFGDTAVQLKNPIEGAEIRYTLDGTEPTPTSFQASGRITIRPQQTLAARTVLKNGRMSYPQAMTSVLVNPSLNGVQYSYYEGNWDSIPDVRQLVASKVGSAFDIALDAAPHGTGGYALQFDGFFDVDSSGEYTFYLVSDDGSKLAIDGKELISNDGLHGSLELSSKVTLTAGKHGINVIYFQRGGDQALQVSYEGPQLSKQVIAPQRFFLQ